MENKADRLAALLRLKRDANQILTEMGVTMNVPGAINWADLQCVEASYVFSDDGVERLQVLVEEASPDASELRLTVGERLKHMGWGYVEVLTEW